VITTAPAAINGLRVSRTALAFQAEETVVNFQSCRTSVIGTIVPQDDLLS
jgi:hypothetical protein